MLGLRARVLLGILHEERIVCGDKSGAGCGRGLGGGQHTECPMALLSAPLSWAGKVGMQGHSARCSPSLQKGSARASGLQLARLGVQEAVRRVPELALAATPCPACSLTSLSPWDNQGSTTYSVFPE